MKRILYNAEGCACGENNESEGFELDVREALIFLRDRLPGGSVSFSDLDDINMFPFTLTLAEEERVTDYATRIAHCPCSVVCSSSISNVSRPPGESHTYYKDNVLPL